MPLEMYLDVLDVEMYLEKALPFYVHGMCYDHGTKIYSLKYKTVMQEML